LLRHQYLCSKQEYNYYPQAPVEFHFAVCIFPSNIPVLLQKRQPQTLAQHVKQDAKHLYKSYLQKQQIAGNPYRQSDAATSTIEIR
jgi:hypothetical protein